MAKPAPTAEQQAAVVGAVALHNLVLEAGAGTGKTSTLVLIGEALQKLGLQGLYCAYNADIAAEASGKMPANVTCKTAHAAAFPQFGKQRIGRIQGPRTAAHNPAFKYGKGTEGFVDMFGVKGYGAGEDRVTPRQIAVSVKNTLSRFCNSRSDRIEWRHVDVPETLDGEDAVRFRKHVMPYAEAAWQDLCDEDGRLTQPYMTHDAYLKMWSLAKPQLGFDFILFDEAQDANPCIAAVIEAQRCQKIMVGDRAQAIYGWRGAEDAMEKFDADERLFLSQSFRFGPAIAEYAMRWLKYTGTPLQLKGFDLLNSKIEPLADPDAVLCRTNAGCIQVAMTMQAAGKKVAFAGGKKFTAGIESFVRAAVNLMEGKNVEHATLGLYKDWSEVLEAVENGEADDLGPMVRLIDKYSTDDILAVCRSAARPEQADVMVSTAHKAKGLEWDRVRIHNDFLPPRNEDNTISKSEAMLIYVAVTRAKMVLDNSALSWLDCIENGEAVEPTEGAE